MTKEFRVVSSFASWSHFILGPLMIVVASVIWFGSVAQGDEWSRDPFGWVWYVLMVVVGFLSIRFGLKMPRQIRLHDDGLVELNYLRSDETIRAKDIVWIKPYGSTLRVKLERGFRYWHRDYSGLHELLSLLKEHNPKIELRGL